MICPRPATANAVHDESPSWSPDGRRLVFMRDVDPIAEQVDYDLFTMTAAGTGQRRLTRSSGSDDRWPDWSPDGREIAFVSLRDSTEENPESHEIYTMRADGSQQVNRTQHPAFDVDPHWGP